MPYVKKPNPALVLLQIRFPLAFDKPRRPLAVGIREEIRAVISVEELSELQLQQALASHTGRITYLQACLAAAARRVHLDGTDAGAVSVEGQRVAAEKLAVIEAQKQARQQREAERKANLPPPPAPKKPPAKPVKAVKPAKPIQPVQPVTPTPAAPTTPTSKPRKEKTMPIVQVKKRRVLVKD